MQSLSCLRALAGLATLVVVLSGGGRVPAQGNKNPNTKNVSFKTHDGVQLSGTLYPNSAGKRDATVLMLHNFDLKKGGSSQQEGWSTLASTLQTQGYVVLTFDFRGFGESKAVNAQTFWSHKHNNTYIRRRGARLPESIDHKDFTNVYARYLVNDIAAAKVYLDRLNDNREANTSSLIVLGAGEGATLGALWMANETRRARDRNKNPLLIGVPPDLAEPESNDLAAGIWLSPSPTLAGFNVPVGRWIGDAGKTKKVPMAFVFGKNDARGDQFARTLERYIKPSAAKSKEFPLTGVKPIADTKLAAEKLLQSDLETEKWIIGYVNQVMGERGAKVRTDRKPDEHAYWYIDLKTGRPLRLNKKAGEEVPPVDLTLFLQGG